MPWFLYNQSHHHTLFTLRFKPHIAHCSRVYRCAAAAVICYSLRELLNIQHPDSSSSSSSSNTTSHTVTASSRRGQGISEGYTIIGVREPISCSSAGSVQGYISSEGRNWLTYIHNKGKNEIHCLYSTEYSSTVLLYRYAICGVNCCGKTHQMHSFPITPEQF